LVHLFQERPTFFKKEVSIRGRRLGLTLVKARRSPWGGCLADENMNEKPVIDLGEQKVLSLPAETQFVPNGIASRTLMRTPGSRVVLFGFAAGQELTEHTSPHHALVQILSGACEFGLGGAWQQVKAGDVIYMPPNLPHAVKATEQFSMLLTLFKAEAPPS
jgi:quercetin dioxygenase-like cupin family protein